MTRRRLRLAPLVLFTALLGATTTVVAQEPPQRKLIEIYRIAPGKHVEFLRLIARFDAASKEAGLPPRDLYVHQDGAGWDFMLIQNAEYTDEQSAKLKAASERLGLPRGARFFVEFRQNVAEHSDTYAEGPTTAEAWLRKLE